MSDVSSQMSNVVPVGMPEGTSVLVEDLFVNVPARRKFLKTIATEFRHIVEVVNNFALAFPEIGFSLKHNGKQVLSYAQTSGIKDNNNKIPGVSEARIRQVLGGTIFDQLMPIHFDHPHLQISGYVGKPQIAHDVKYKQWLFVNNRRVSDRGITRVIKNAYGTLLPARVYPVFVLYVTSPPEMVDVNVHPRKEEVKFVNSQLVYSSVIKAVKHVLEKSDLGFISSVGVREVRGVKELEDSSSFVKGGVARGSSDYGKQPWVSEEQRNVSYEINAPLKADRVSEAVLPWGDDAPYGASQAGRIMQVHNLYLITQTDKGIIIYDQHAAHERVMYEKLLQLFKERQKLVQKQPLLMPVKFDLSINEAEVLKENMEVLAKLGFEIDDAPVGASHVTELRHPGGGPAGLPRGGRGRKGL